MFYYVFFCFNWFLLNGESNLLLPVKSSLLLAIFMNKSMLALSFIIFPRNTSTFSYRKTCNLEKKH